MRDRGNRPPVAQRREAIEACGGVPLPARRCAGRCAAGAPAEAGALHRSRSGSRSKPPRCRRRVAGRPTCRSPRRRHGDRQVAQLLVARLVAEPHRRSREARRRVRSDVQPDADHELALVDAERLSPRFPDEGRSAAGRRSPRRSRLPVAFTVRTRGIRLGSRGLFALAWSLRAATVPGVRTVPPGAAPSCSRSGVTCARGGGPSCASRATAGSSTQTRTVSRAVERCRRMVVRFVDKTRQSGTTIRAPIPFSS